MKVTARQKFWTKHRADLAMVWLLPAQLNRIEKLTADQFWECFTTDDGIKLLESVKWPFWLEEEPKDSPAWAGPPSPDHRAAVCRCGGVASDDEEAD